MPETVIGASDDVLARSDATGTSCSSARCSGQPVGGVYAFKRAPVYTATARLSAISVNATNAASLAGSLQAAQELASTFARVVQSTQVANDVAKALHTTPAWAAAHLSGTPVPSSPFVSDQRERVEPRGRHEAANAALKAVDRVRAQARQRVIAPGASTLWPRFATYSVQATRAQSHLGHLKGQAAGEARQASLLGETSTTRDPRLQNQIEQATADVADAQTQLNGAQSAYTQQAENQLGSRTDRHRRARR